MAKYRFRLSDMLPHSWFHKLKDMGRRRRTTITRNTTAMKKQIPPPPSEEPYTPSRASYYIPSTMDKFPLDPPRKSNKSTRSRPIKDVAAAAAGSGLPPVQTKPSKKEITLQEEEHYRSPKTRSPMGTQGFKMRTISPRLHTSKKGNRKAAPMPKRGRGLLESFAVVKSSSDPQKDFRESMVEMIVENEIREWKDLEDLLACYLALNSMEYHDLILKVFEQIWSDLVDITM